MDHLPYPANADFPPLEIPFICEDLLTCNQDGSMVFFHIPSFLGFLNHDSEATKYWEKCDADRVAVKAQAVIYFGFLSDMLGDLFVLGDFVRLSSQSNELAITLATFEAQFRAASQRIRLEEIKELATTAVYHAGIIRQRSELASRIARSIDILAWSILLLITDSQGNLYPGSWREVNAGLLEDRLLAAGWCPYWIKIFSHAHSAPLLHYLTGMQVEAHSGAKPCSIFECHGHNVDMEKGKYVSKHTDSSCRCDFKGPDTSTMESIIRRGGVPLIKLSETPHGEIQVEAVRLEYGKPFIAISHVWAGGLGNPLANTIPSCQLKFIYRAAKKCRNKEYGKGLFRMAHEADVTWKQTKFYKAVERVLGEDETPDQGPLEWYLDMVDKSALWGANEDSNDLYIWFDTFCIPISKKEEDCQNSEEVAIANEKFELKMIAINKMAFVYATAMHILVIEHSIRDISYRQTGDLELAALLLTSAWMSRCWTFQEACLARQFSFILSDQLIDPRKWNANTPEDRCGSAFERVLKIQCLEHIDAMPDVMNRSVETRAEDQTGTLVAVWNALSSRSTTKREDLHGLLAIMLNMSALEILKMDQNQRMLAITRAQEKLPLSMLLFAYPETAPLTEGCEWLPSYPSGTLSEHFGYMTWSSGGEGLTFVPSETESILLLIELDIVLESSRFLLKIPESNSVVVVEFPPPKDIILSKYRTETICILLHGYNKLVIGLLKGVGACFVLNSGKASEQQQLRLTFICSITYSMWKSSSEESISTSALASKLSDGTNISVERVKPGATCLLRLDYINWPETRYQRPKAHRLQNSLSRGAFVLIGSIWCTVLAYDFSSPGSDVWCYSFYESFEYTLKLWRFPSWLKRINIPMNILYWMFHYPRISCGSMIIFTRLTSFFLLEYPTLEFIAQRIRYERYADSFDFVDSSAKPKIQRRFGQELLYQYQPLWKLGVAAGISALNLVAATWPAARPWLIYLPRSPAIHPRLIEVVGKAIICETVARVCWELLWRWMRMDTPAERRKHIRKLFKEKG